MCKKLHDSNQRVLAMIACGLALMSIPATGQVIDDGMKILANDGRATDLFGTAVSVRNNRIAVGAWSDWDNSLESGSAYIYNASSGVQLFKLLPHNPAMSDRFGESVAVGNGIVVVGAPHHAGDGSGSGSAYIFDINTGQQLFHLVPNDGGGDSDFFGISVAIENDIIAIGSQNNSNQSGSRAGAVYLFDAKTGKQTAKLITDDGDENRFFGRSVSIDDGILAVGAWLVDDEGGFFGSAYLFNASDGQQLFKLVPEDGELLDYFRFSIGINDGMVVIDSKFAQPNGYRSGAAYLFDASTGEQVFKLLPSDNVQNDAFGQSVAIDHGVIAVGAPGDDENGLSASGSVYFFDALTGEQVSKYLAPDPDHDDEFGGDVALDGVHLVVGVAKDDDFGLSSGSAYVYSLPTVACSPADLTGDGALDFFDVSEFLEGYAVEDPAVDFTGDGIWNFFDVAEFLEMLGAGCS